MSFPLISNVYERTQLYRVSHFCVFNRNFSRSGHDPKKFWWVSVEDSPIVEEIVQRNIFIYDFDIQEREYVGKLARRSIGNLNNVTILTFSSVFDVPAVTVSSTYQTTSTNIFWDARSSKAFYPKNVYELRETLFENLEGFHLPVSEENKRFKNLAIFDFESICVPEKKKMRRNLKPGLENMF